jgi:amino acid adenylation domain-containing protein
VSVSALLKQLASQGVELWFEGERLRFRAPNGVLTAPQRAEVSARRAEVLAQLRRDAGNRRASFPLSFSQRSLWFLHQQAPESTAYHIATSVRILSTVQPGALRLAAQALLDRHAILRTTYEFVHDAPRQIVAGTAAAIFDLHERPGLSEQELRRQVEADFRRPFDLEAGPVLRASLYTRGPEDHVLLLTVHHVAADGWSLRLLFQEFTRLYEEFTGGRAAGLSRPTVEYVDYSAWQEQMLRGPEGERLWGYWRERLAAPRAPQGLPSDRPRPPLQSGRGASFSFDLPTTQVERVKVLARQEGTTAFVVLLTCFQAFLHRLTNRDDIIVGTPTFGRGKAEFVNVVGDFVNPVPLRVRLEPGVTWRALLVRVCDAVHGALDAQEYPLPLLVERLHPERDAGRTPLFDTFFSLHRFDQFRDLEELLIGSESSTVIEFSTLRLASYPLSQLEGQFDLALVMAERAGVLRGVFKYSVDVFEEATIIRWAADYAAFVEAFLSDPEGSVASLPAPGLPARAPESVAALLDSLASRDIRLWLDGDRLRVNAPKGVLDEALKNLIGSRKEEFIAELRARNGAGAARVGGTIPRLPRGGPLPVSSVQQRLWFLDRMDPGRPVYNIGLGVRFRGPLDASTLRRALDVLVSRHESLRTRIFESEGSPVAEILPAAGTQFDLVDLGHLTPEVREKQMRHLQAVCLREPFDLGKGLLSRFLLIRLALDEHVLCFSMHHAVSDGWSFVIAVDETCRLYETLSAGRTPDLPALSVQYVDFAGWEREQLHAGRMAAHFAYWKQQLAGTPPVLELPLDRPRPAVQSLRGSRLKRHFEAEFLQSLKERSRQEGVTLFMTLLAAWQVLLHRLSGQDDIVVGSPVANRDQPALQNLIGCLVNNVALRGNLAGNPRFTEYLARVKQTTLDAFEHSELPFDVVVDGLSPQRSASHAPLFQVLFTLMSFPTHVAAPAGFAIELVEADTGASRFDLTIELAEMDGRLRAGYEYATDLFDEATIVRLHAHFESLLAAVVEDPSRTIGELPLLSNVQQRLLLNDWNDTGLEHDRGRCVHQLLERMARARPDAVAVMDATESLTYSQLDRRANQLARLLCGRGIVPGALVGVCLDRTVDMPVALAAVLKCGAAYVPLDPSHPADRLRYTLEDAGVFCVITLSQFTAQLADAKAPLLALDELQTELADQPAVAPDAPCKPEDLAYVIYTSGSTGRPKGVEIEHRNVVSFLEAMRREPGLGENDVLLAVTTLSFDIAGLEMWLPLMVGARIVIASRADVFDGHRLAELIDTRGVSLLQATPATWRLLLEAGWAGRPRLKALCGGEALPPDLAISLLDRVGELWNVYGPTETTIWSAVYRVHYPQGTIPVGRGIANTRVYVLEPSGAPAPIGVAGELCIAGEGVARGYRNRPELTAEKFVTITLSNGSRERVYRTGDMARWRADGQLEFVGRNDTQVKVRGYRIELGEIEAVLSTRTDIKECVVIVHEDRPGDQRLIGYLVAAAGAQFDADAARTTLRAKLPEYMIPNLFMVLDGLPLTPNGKIDRKRLPKPQAAAVLGETTAEAGTDVLMTLPQQRVAGIWREVLHVDRIGLHENFFDLGGHSLLLVKLQAALKREFARDLSLVELFQRTTVSAQAERLTSPGAASDALKRAQARAEKQVLV